MEGVSGPGVGAEATVIQVGWVGMTFVGGTVFAVGVIFDVVQALTRIVNSNMMKRIILCIFRYYKVIMPGEFTWHYCLADG